MKTLTRRPCTQKDNIANVILKQNNQEQVEKTDSPILANGSCRICSCRGYSGNQEGGKRCSNCNHLYEDHQEHYTH